MINCPVRPPMPDSARPADAAALLAAFPAELDTLDKPCCAWPAVSETLLAAEDAVSFALLAASEVVDAARRWINARD